MNTLWFCLVAAMLAAYVLLDGFDLGVGILYLGVAHNDGERHAALGTIEPVLDGNEVVLVATGGTLYFAFPALYASAFSGFYLALMIVLWLLILRGVSVAFRNLVRGAVWTQMWDAAFSFSSALLAIFYGVALGNVVRGLPLDGSAIFFEPLWTNFRLGPATGILDWYTILVGLAAYFALSQHGALWLVLKTEGAVAKRARGCAAISWWIVALLTVLITVSSFRIQPQIAANFSTRPWGYVFPGFALAGLAGVRWAVSATVSPAVERRGFFSSCLFVFGMFASAAFGIYPFVLPSRNNLAYSLTIENAAAGTYGLKIGLIWWIIGTALAIAYLSFGYRRFAGKVGTRDHEES